MFFGVYFVYYPQNHFPYMIKTVKKGVITPHILLKIDNYEFIKMNFNIDCEKLLGFESDGISIIEPSQKKYLKVYNYVKLCEIIDAIGNSSASVNKNL